MEALSDSELRRLNWKGFPKYPELKATTELLWKSFNLSRSGPWTSSQLTWLVWELFKAKSLTQFLEKIFLSERPMAPDDLFAFLRSCEFNYPEMLMCLQTSLQRNTSLTPDYSAFVAKLENWFLPEAVKSLEEVGFPIVLFEQLAIAAEEGESADELIARARKFSPTQSVLSRIERQMIDDAAIK